MTQTHPEAYCLGCENQGDQCTCRQLREDTEPQQRIEVLVGPPASGKTTYAREAARQGAIIINDDAIYLGLHAGEYQLYDQELKPLYKAVETATIVAAIQAGRRAVIDRPNVKWNTRQRYIQLARTFEIPVIAVVFPFESPEIHAARRYQHGNRNLSYNAWLAACKRMFREYETPSDNEGFDRIDWRDQAPPIAA